MANNSESLSSGFWADCGLLGVLGLDCRCVERFLGGVLGAGFVACDRGCLFGFGCDCLAEVFCLVWG